MRGSATRPCFWPAGAAENESALGLIKVLAISPTHPIAIESYQPRLGLSTHKDRMYQHILADFAYDKA